MLLLMLCACFCALVLELEQQVVLGRYGRLHSYLNVGDAETGQMADLGSRYAGRLEAKHSLEVGLQVCYGGRHGD
jgi:hypothetical protein